MKRFRTIGFVLLALGALGAMLASTASAIEGVLPLTKKDFLVEGGKSTLATGNAAIPPVICEKLDDSNGEMENDHHSKPLTLHWLGCTAGGLAANSAGDKSGEILAEVSFLVCLVETAALLFGIAAETAKTVLIEVPALGLKVEVKGDVIGHVLPTMAPEEKTKHAVVDFTGEKGKQTVKKCTDEAGGTKEHSLLAKIDNGAFETASENVVNGLVLFLEEVQFMDK